MCIHPSELRVRGIASQLSLGFGDLVDPLSDILTMLTAQTVTQLRFESRGPYAMRFGAYEHLKFGAVLSGRFCLRLDSWAEPVEFEAGDCYLLTDGQPFRTFNGEAPEIDGLAYLEANRGPGGVVRLGENPPDKVVIVGQFRFDPEVVGWLRSALPPMIHIKADAPQAAPLRTTLSLLDAESRGALGESVIIDRIADILLVQALRAHAKAEHQETGWLAGLGEPRIARALQAFHMDVAANWSVASLAVPRCLVGGRSLRPHAKLKEDMRRHVQGVRRRGRDCGVAAGGWQRQDSVIRVIKGVQKIVRRAGMVGLRTVDLLGDSGGSHAGSQCSGITWRPRIGRASRIGAPQQRERIEGRRFNVVWVISVEICHGVGIGPVTFRLLALAIKGLDGLEIGPLAGCEHR
jgi:Cupin